WCRAHGRGRIRYWTSEAIIRIHIELGAKEFRCNGRSPHKTVFDASLRAAGALRPVGIVVAHKQNTQVLPRFTAVEPSYRQSFDASANRLHCSLWLASHRLAYRTLGRACPKGLPRKQHTSRDRVFAAAYSNRGLARDPAAVAAMRQHFSDKELTP